MSKVGKLDAVTEYANQLILTEVVDEVAHNIPYPQIWYWHAPIPRHLRTLILDLDNMAADFREPFERSIPPELFIPNRLTLSTNFALDVLLYTSFISPEQEIKQGVHLIPIAQRDRFRVRKQAKLHKLPHWDLSVIELAKMNFTNNVTSFYKS